MEKEQAWHLSDRKPFQAEEAASAKALRQELAWYLEKRQVASVTE